MGNQDYMAMCEIPLTMPRTRPMSKLEVAASGSTDSAYINHDGNEILNAASLTSTPNFVSGPSPHRRPLRTIQVILNQEASRTCGSCGAGTRWFGLVEQVGELLTHGAEVDAEARGGDLEVGGGVNVLGSGGCGREAGGRVVENLLEESEALLNVGVSGVELDELAVGVKGVVVLFVAGFIEGAEVVLDLGDVQVEFDGAGVAVEGFVVAVDLVVEDAHGAPNGWVGTVAHDGLVAGLVCLIVLCLCHVAAAKEVPELGVGEVPLPCVWRRKRLVRRGRRSHSGHTGCR